MLKLLNFLISGDYRNESPDTTAKRKQLYYSNIKGTIQHPQSLKCHGTLMPPDANCTLDEWMNGAFSKLHHKN